MLDAMLIGEQIIFLGKHSCWYFKEKGSQSYAEGFSIAAPNTRRFPPFSTNFLILDPDARRAGRSLEYLGLPKPVGIIRQFNVLR